MRLVAILAAALPALAQEPAEPFLFKAPPTTEKRFSEDIREFLEKEGFRIEIPGDGRTVQFAARAVGPCSIPLLRLGPAPLPSMDPNFRRPRVTPYMPVVEPPAPPCEDWPGVDRRPLVIRRSR